MLPTNPLPSPVPVPVLLPRLPPAPPPSAAFDTPPLAPVPTPAGLAVPATPRGLMSPIPIPRSPGPSVLAPGQRDGAPQASVSGYAIRLSEGDIQQTGKFVREFAVMNLIPWMEKCVMEWNENVSCVNLFPFRRLISDIRSSHHHDDYPLVCFHLPDVCSGPLQLLLPLRLRHLGTVLILRYPLYRAGSGIKLTTLSVLSLLYRLQGPL